MRFFKALLAGLATSALIVGALVYRYQHLTPVSQQPESPAAPATTNFQQAKLPNAVIEGRIDIAPLLADQAAKFPVSSVAIQIWHITEEDTSRLVGRVGIDSPKFPVAFRADLAQAFTEGLFREGKPATLRLVASFCPNKLRDSCNPDVLPISSGAIDVIVKAPSSPVDTAVTPVLALASIDNLVIDRSAQAPRIADCVHSGLTLSGNIQPTNSLVTEPSHPSRFVLVATPRDRFDMHGPFVEADHSPLTRAEMAGAMENNIVYAGFTLAGPKPVPFSMKLPKGSELTIRNFLAVACKPGEDDIACAAKLFPVPRVYATSYPKIGATRLIPKDLEDPMCGVPTVLFFNNWNPEAPPPTIEAFKKAQPPEVVEGMHF